MEYVYKYTNFYDMFAYGSVYNNIRVSTLKQELPILKYCKTFVMLNESQIKKDDILIYRVGSAGKIDWSNKKITGGDQSGYR